MKTQRRPVVAIGVGNPTRGDDGLGPAVVQEMRRQPSSENIELVVLTGEATSFLDIWAERELAVVIDAVVSGSPPGTIHQLEVGIDQLPNWSSTGGTHSTGVVEAVALGAALDRLPRRLVLFGVEATDVSLGAGISDAVRAAMPEVLEQVRVVASRATNPRG